MIKAGLNFFENQDDLYKFKVPSLRNVEHSFPYMHDGRFETLEAVVNFYDSGLTDNGNVDPLLVAENGDLGIPLTDYEKQSLVAFFKNTYR
jgi:cytochrome c peroxidase